MFQCCNFPVYVKGASWLAKQDSDKMNVVHQRERQLNPRPVDNIDLATLKSLLKESGSLLQSSLTVSDKVFLKT